MSNRGITLIALGHPYYGNYAHQLALSLRFTAPDIKIALVHDEPGIRHLTEKKKTHFNYFILAPKETYQTHQRNDFLKTKTFLYDLTPFTETLYLDADMLWLPRRSANEIFERFKDIDFTMQCRSAMDLENITNEKQIQWAQSSDIKRKYGTGKLYNVSSEFIYFKKNREAKKIFTAAKKIHDNPGIPNNPFAGAVADELSFSLSLLQNSAHLHQDVYQPCYWEAMQGRRLQPPQLYDAYYAYSFGGAFASDYEQKFYNNLVQIYCNKFGVQYFPLKQKRTFISTRSKI